MTTRQTTSRLAPPEPTTPTTSSKRVSTCPFEPARNNPAAAAQFVRSLFKQRPHKHSLPVTELAPLFGFGPDSSRNVIARIRTQSVFASREIRSSYNEFAINYARGRWNLPVAKWEATMALVRKHGSDKKWSGAGWSVPSAAAPAGSGPEVYYARFIIVVLARLKRGVGIPWMMMWLRDALTDGRVDDVCWVLFHTLLYLQLESMRCSKDAAPLREVAGVYVHKVIGRSSLLGAFSRVFASRAGLADEKV